MIIKYKQWPGNIPPRWGTANAAGFDLAVPEDVYIRSGTIEVIDLKIGFEPMAEDLYIMLYPRSSMLAKRHLIIDSAVIDNDYRGPVHAVVYNPMDQDVLIRAGEYIMQAVVCQSLPIVFERVEALNETVRNEQGLGSTDRTTEPLA